jgi:DNA/RNA-binding domain of Phe-tRNA-synthetase-like protein
MDLTIDERIKAIVPDLALGVLTAHAAVQPSQPDLCAELERSAELARQNLEGTDLPQLPEIQAVRKLYRGLGKDPTRYRGASEALLRRILLSKGLYFINTAVDVCNLVSIETRHSLGAYDLDCVSGAVKFRPAAEGEVYRGIGRGEINLEGLPVFSDSHGAFGSPTSDSERTMITLATSRVCFVIIACCRRDRLDADMARATELLKRYCAGSEFESVIIEAAT